MARLAAFVGIAFNQLPKLGPFVDAVRQRAGKVIVELQAPHFVAGKGQTRLQFVQRNETLLSQCAVVQHRNTYPHP